MSRDWDDDKLARLIAGSRASAAPETLAHVRSRLAARTSAPRWIAWLSRPAALGASAALLVVSAVAGGAMVSGSTASTDGTTLVSDMLGDDGTYGLGSFAATDAATGVADTGKVTP